MCALCYLGIAMHMQESLNVLEEQTVNGHNSGVAIIGDCM